MACSSQVACPQLGGHRTALSEVLCMRGSGKSQQSGLLHPPYPHNSCLAAGPCVLLLPIAAGGSSRAAGAEDERLAGFPAAALFLHQRLHLRIWATAVSSEMAHGPRTSARGPPKAPSSPSSHLMKGHWRRVENKGKVSLNSACPGPICKQLGDLLL